MADTATLDVPLDRASTRYWIRMLDASSKRRFDVNKFGAMVARWDAGDLHDLIDPKATFNGERWRSGLDNQHALAVTASMADLFFRAPRPVVKTPRVPKKAVLPPPGMPPEPTPPASVLFSPDLAECEREMLNQELQRANYFEEATRSLQDALNFDMGIIKVTHDADTSLDRETLDAAKVEAQEEIKAFLEATTQAQMKRAMWAKEGQVHSVHMEEKGQLLTQAERGSTVLDSTGIAYLRNHIKAHSAMKGDDRPTETVRANSLRFESISPLDYYYDPVPRSRDRKTWVATRFMRRWDDVVTNEDWNEVARGEVKACDDRWESRAHMPSVETPGPYDLPERMVMIFEVFDLVEQKRILYADGATTPLLIEDRGALAVLQPSGPFYELVFRQDALEGQGIPPAVAYAAEAAAASHIAASNVAAAIQNQARTIYDPRRLPPDQVAKAWAAPVGTATPIEWKGSPDGKVDDAWGQVPPCEIHESSMLVKAQCDQGVQMRSGLGVAKMMGGESSPTATGAALGADASGSISEDRGAKVDAWATRTYRGGLALIRYFTPHSWWVQCCGDAAIEAVPERFSLSDSANGIGVDVIAGSARRRNTNVDQEQLLKGIEMLIAIPAMAGPRGQGLILDAARQFMEDGGSTGLDWDSVKEEVEMAALMAQMAPPGEEEGGEDGDEMPHDRGKEENQGVAQNDLEQGAQNPSGGRVGVNQSVGQRVVANREAAQKRVAARG